MRGRVIMCRYNPSLITQYTAIHFTLRQELGWWPRLMRHPWLCTMQRVYLCLMPQYLLSAITIVYWVFTHSITPPPASPSRVIYQVRGPDTGFNARSMQIIRGYGGRRTQDTRVSNYLETTLNIAHHYHHHYHHHYDHLQVLDNQASETGKVRLRESLKPFCVKSVLLSCRQKCWSHRRKVFSILLMK